MVKNENIFLGSGASLTMVPEIDLYLKIATSSGSADGTSAELTLHADYNWVLLVPDLYVGCTVDFYDHSDATPTVPTSTHTIKSNTTTTITLASSTGFGASGGGHSSTYATNDYIIIRGYGAPCYGMKLNDSGAQSDQAIGEPTSTGFDLAGNVRYFNQAGRYYIYYAHA